MKTLNSGSLKYELMSGCESTGQIRFLVKCVDSGMGIIVQFNDWLVEEMDNMAEDTCGGQ